MKHWQRATLFGGLFAGGLIACAVLWLALAPHTRIPAGDQPTERPDAAYKAGGPQCDPQRLQAITSPEEREAKAADCAQAQEQHRAQQADLDQQTRAANAGAIEAWFAYDQTRIAAAQAILSIIGTIFTALAAWAAVVAARAAQTSIEEGRRSSEKQLRAYLGVEAGTAFYNLEDRTITVHPVIQNTGQTPAYNVRYYSDLAIMTFKQAENFNFAAPEVEGISRVTIGRDMTIVMGINLAEPVSTATLHEVLTTRVGGTDRVVFVYGQVHYDDAFGNAWTTNFCRFVIWNVDAGADEPAHWLYGFKRHNEAT